MAKYRKKPVVIEAWPTVDTMPAIGRIRVVTPFERNSAFEVYDELHDTWVKFERGDWIIRGVKGEFYPCKPDVFVATYEEVDG